MSQAFVAASSQGITADEMPINTTDVPFSVSMWVNPTSLIESMVCFSANTGVTANSYVLIHTVGGTKRIAAVRQGVASADSSNVISTGSWQHVVAVFSSTSAVAIYLDNTKTTASGAGLPIGALSVMSLGCYWTGAALFNPWDGLIADARIWNFALSDSEVAQLYAGAPAKNAVQPGGLSGSWELINGILNPTLRGVVLTNRGSSVSNASNPRYYRGNGGG